MKLKVKNKKVIREIAWTTYQANKKRNFLTVFAVILTTFLIAGVMATGFSYWNTISERNVRMEGMDYDIELTEPDERQTEKIRSMDHVKYAGVAVKCAVLEQYQEKILDKVRLYWLDDICWTKQTVPAVESFEGHYPQKENEIMLGMDTLTAMGISEPKTGMVLPVTYYTLKEDFQEKLLEKEFVLCGWYTDYSGSKRGYVSKEFYDTTGVRQTDFTQGALKITLKNPLYSKDNIIAMQNAIGMNRNQVIAADYDTVSNFIKTSAVLAVTLFMIFFSGYLFIYNTMYISISKDIRYYGQLKTVGVTSGQLRKVVYSQVAMNAAAGIPLGILASVAVTKVVIPKLLGIVNPTFSADDVVPVKIWVFVLAGGFSLLTNFISCRKPAKMAGKCSIIEALRYTGGKVKERRRECGGVYSMAFRNMFRDKKQAAVVLASFVIAISVFITISVAIQANDARRILNKIYDCDIRFTNETMLDDDRRQLLTEEKISRTEKIKGVKSVRKVVSAEAVIPYQEDVYGTYYRELYQSRYSPGNYENDMESYKKGQNNDLFTARLIGIDKNGFKLLNESMGNILDWDEFNNGNTAVAVKMFTEGDNGIINKRVHFLLPDGKEPEKEHSVIIAAAGDIQLNPAYFAGGYSPDLIVSENYAKQLLAEPLTELIQVEYEDAFSEETEKQVKEIFAGEKQITFNSKLERYQEMKNSEYQVKVLGGCIAFIIALLAVLNYVNMMAAGIWNRSVEFATLESIGMTTGQMKKMLRAEGCGYALISAVVSLAAGIPVSHAVFQGMNRYSLSFSIPWAGNLVLFSVIYVVCLTVPVIIYARTLNLSITERLQNADGM